MACLRPLVFSLLAGACAWVAGCAAAEPEADDEASTAAIVQSQVHVLDAEPGTDFELQEDRIIASRERFAELEGYAAGDVIVSGKAAGLLRRVRSHRIEGANIIVETEPATLEDVFKQVHLSGSIDERHAQGKSGLAPQGLTLKLPMLDFEDHRIEIGQGSVIELVDGKFSFEPSLDFDLRMRDGKLDHFKMIASGKTDGKLHVRYHLHRPPGVGSGAFIRTDDGYPIVEAPPYYTVFMAGYVPVVIAVRMRLLANWALTAGGDVDGDQSVQGNGAVTTGLEYNDGQWKNVGSHALSVSTLGAPNVPDHQVSGDITLTARLDVSFYDLAGPYVGLQAYAGVGHQGSANGSGGASTSPTGGWFTEEGLRGLAGAQVSVFGKGLVGYEAVLFDVRKQQPL